MVPLMSEANKLVALCLCVFLTAGAWIPLATMGHERTTAESDTAWEVRTGGTRGDPIMIYNVDDLQAMKNDLTADYALVNDIDATATKEWNDGAGFEPIGDYDNRFTSSLDGQGYTISGLYINRPATDYLGLFGYIGSRGSVSNVGMKDVDITGDRYVGGLVGLNYGSVSDSFYDHETTGRSDTGKGTPKTTAEMKTRSTFTDAGWDFDNVWWLIGRIPISISEFIQELRVDVLLFDSANGLWVYHVRSPLTRVAYRVWPAI